MSIATELQNYADGLDDAYDAVNDMSGIIPQHKNMNNLDQAIRTIPQNTGTTYTAGNGIDIDANNEISIDNTVVPEFSDLATVATTGNYSDLSGTPAIPTKTSDLVNDGADNTSTYVEADELATVATSGSYNDLLNTPTIPAAQVNSDWDSNSGVSQILNKPTLATVATSGDYDDLSNKPTIPAAQVNSDWNAASGVAQILNKPSLATVATSGSYNDLSNKPTIPAAQVQSNWTQTTTTAVDYIKNKPGIKNATAQTHTDYNNNQDYLPNMRFLSFWNGAYNSSGNSNLSYLASNAVKTANINNSAVTNDKISNNTIAMGKINWSTMRAAFTGTTDGNGFIAVPTGTVKPTTGFILGARRVKNNDTGQTDGILMPYTDHSQSRYTLKFVNWNLQANGNQTIKVEIIYCLLS